MRVVQVVRNFGPTGGMEEYAWQLTNCLAQKGLSISVVCERAEHEMPEGVQIYRIPRQTRGPGWFQALKFSNNLSDWKAQNGRATDFFHSHEFVRGADILTFHTTLHSSGQNSLLKRFDPSWHGNQWLERKAILSPQLKSLVPVSDLLGDQLRKAYPKAKSFLSTAIVPGVLMPSANNLKSDSSNGKAIGFMGKEWGRKGLRLVIEVFRQLNERGHELKLVIAGVGHDEIGNLIEGLSPKVEVMGWITDKEEFYNKVDLLLHPAKLEAYGMVVTEALSRGIPVLVSDQVGASQEIKTGLGRVLPLTKHISQWADAAWGLLKTGRTNDPMYKRSWEQVASEYQELYARVLSGNK